MCGVIVVDAGRSRSTCLRRDAYIHDDTGFCHNYCHRSVISMTEKIRSAQNVTDVPFFVV